LYVGLPRLYHQLVKVNQFLLNTTTNQTAWANEVGLTEFLDSIGLDGTSLAPQVTQQLNELIGELYLNISSFSANYIDRVGTVFGFLFFVVVLPFLLFFMIRDYDRIRNFVQEF